MGGEPVPVTFQGQVGEHSQRQVGLTWQPRLTVARQQHHQRSVKNTATTTIGGGSDEGLNRESNADERADSGLGHRRVVRKGGSLLLLLLLRGEGGEE